MPKTKKVPTKKAPKRATKKAPKAAAPKKKDGPVARARAILAKNPDQSRADYLTACEAAGINKFTALFARLHREAA